MKRASAERPDERILVGVACASATALTLALALPLLRGQIYLDSDLLNLHLPLRVFYQRALREGSEFLWFPHEFAGFYLHGDGEGGLYHPLNLLSYRWLSLPLAFNLELLRSAPFALLGAFLLLRRFELPRSAALLGGILFAFSGFQLLHYTHPNLVGVTAHLPWLLLALDLLARGGPSLGTALAAPLYALLTASQLLLGHPQAFWMTLLVELFFCVGLARGGAARSVFLRAASAKGLGVLAAAIQLLPTWEALRHSMRSDASAEFVDSFALDPLDLVQLVQPYLFTQRVVEKNATELGIYAGALGLIALAWLALREQGPGLPRRLGRGALALALLGTWLALGARGGLYTIVTSLPLVGLFRAPSRYVLLLHVASALAAALVFAELALRPPERPRRAERALGLGLPVLSAALALWLLARDPDAVEGPGPAALGVAVCAATGLLFCVAERGRTVALAALLALACLDVGAYGLSYIEQRNPLPTSFAALQRGLSVPPEARRYRLLVGPSELTMLGVRYLGGYVALWPQRELPHLAPSPPEPEAMATWRAAMRVASVATEGADPPLPRVRLLTRAEVSAQPRRDIAAIDVANTALVDQAVALDAGEPGEATLLEERPGEIVLATRAPGRQLLSVSESFHAGWRAWIDGEPAAVLRLYGDFLGCVVPPGEHRVRLHFEPWSFTWGTRISELALAAILVWLAAAAAGARRLRSAPPGAPPAA